MNGFVVFISTRNDAGSHLSQRLFDVLQKFDFPRISIFSWKMAEIVMVVLEVVVVLMNGFIRLKTFKIVYHVGISSTHAHTQSTGHISAETISNFALLIIFDIRIFFSILLPAITIYPNIREFFGTLSRRILIVNQSCWILGSWFCSDRMSLRSTMWKINRFFCVGNVSLGDAGRGQLPQTVYVYYIGDLGDSKVKWP